MEPGEPGGDRIVEVDGFPVTQFAGASQDSLTWRIIPVSATDSPHAPWWNQASLAEAFNSFRLNPTAELLGYFYEHPEYGNRKFLTFGAGIRYDIYGFDFSYISAADNHPLSDTIRFSLLIAWGGDETN